MTELERLRQDNQRLRNMLIQCGGWVYFREADPDAKPRPMRHRHSQIPPGKYVEICRLCGEYRTDGHASDCPIQDVLKEQARGCVVCGRLPDNPPGPPAPARPDGYYCTTHRHLQRRSEYA